MSLLIEFRQRKIAAEIVFPDDKLARTTTNAFRFVFKSYMYHKDLTQLDYAVDRNMSIAIVNRNVGLSVHANATINLEMAKDICEFFNINFEHMCMIAEKFVNNPEYNSISFAPGKVIFLIAFRQNFSR